MRDLVRRFIVLAMLGLTVGCGSDPTQPSANSDEVKKELQKLNAERERERNNK